MAKSAGESVDLVAGLDIGTTKIVCTIATVNGDDFDIVGVGEAASSGIRQGSVVNIEATTEAILKAREEAELMSGYEINNVFVGIAGTNIQSFDSKGMVAIRNQEVAQDDIERVIEAAKAVAVPADREVIHVLPREYRIDDQDGIQDPIGMSGVRLEASVHIVTGSQMAMQNIVKCTEKAGLKISGFVLQQLASSLAVLSDDEKSLGAGVIDMGGGTCDIILYTNGSVSYTCSLPIGGQHFTHDIAVGLRTPHTDAEELKKKYGSALVTVVDSDENIDVPGVGGREPRSVQRRNLCEVLEPRAEEVLSLIEAEIEKSEMLNKLGSGLVLTGGASQLDGLIEMSEFIFDIPVRRGASHAKGLTDVVKSPSYSTAVGLLIYGMQKDRKVDSIAVDSSLNGWVGGWSRRLKELLGGAI